MEKEFSAAFFIIGFNTECWLYTFWDYGIIWIKVCREVIHMENVYKGLRHTGFTMLLIFGGVFLLRWFIHDEMLLDQLIGFSIGMVMVISSVFIQKYSKELQVNEKY